MSRRGGAQADPEDDFFLIGLFHRDDNFQDQVDGTIDFRFDRGESTSYDISNKQSYSVNGGFFRGTYVSDIGTYEMQIETPINKSDTGVVIVQAHRNAYNEITMAQSSVMAGPDTIPYTYPVQIESSIQIINNWTVSFDRTLGFTPLKIVDQGLSSPQCINDGRPVFDPEDSSADVYESAELNITIATVFAVDLNDTEKVLYYLDSENDNIINETFGIREETGEIYLNKKLDRETRDNYFIYLLARDQGSITTMNGYGTINITVLDTNDNKPEFTSVEYLIAQPIPENTQLDTLVAKVNASDADLGENGTVTYDLQMPYQFRIDNVTGEIFINKSLDYETHTFYNLTVLAIDSGFITQLTSTTQVEIYISPINDNSPMCEPRERLALVPENALTGSEFFTINVLDIDVGSNHSELSYEIMPEEYFGIKKISDMEAVLYTLSEGFNRQEMSSYPRTVLVADAGGRSCNITVTIVIAEPSYMAFEPVDSGFLLGVPQRVAADNGHTQNITFFRSPHTSTAIKATLGTATKTVTISKDLQPTHDTYTVLHQSTIYEDKRTISAYSLQYDSSYSRYHNASDVWLSVVPTTDDDLEVVTGSSCTPVDGVCEVMDVTVPQVWFDTYNSVSVNITGTNIPTSYVGTVTMVAQPAISIATENIYIEVPLSTLHEDDQYTLRVSSHTSTDLLSFHLELNVPLEAIEVANNEQWVCEVYQTNFVCFRHDFSPPSVTDYNTQHIMDITAIMNYTTDVIFTGTVHSMASHYSTIAYDRPAMFIGRDGVNETAVVTVAYPEVVGIVALTTAGEVINKQPFGVSTEPIQMKVLEIYDDTEYALAYTGDLTCTSSDTNTLSVNCASNPAVIEINGNKGDKTEIIVEYNGHQYIQPIRVWYPESIDITVQDGVLNKIKNYTTGGDCQQDYQRSRITVVSEFSAGTLKSGPLDVTMATIDSIHSSNLSVVMIDQGYVVGVNDGVANITMTNASSFLTIIVSNEMVYEYGLYTTVFSAFDLSVTPNTFSADSIITATATYSEVFEHIYTQGHIEAYVYYSDGARQDTSNNVVISTTDESILRVDDTTNTFEAVVPGQANLTITQRPMCSATPTLNTDTAITVSSPDIIDISIDIADTKLADRMGLGLPTTLTFTVIASFSDGSMRDITSDATVESSGDICIDGSDAIVCHNSTGLAGSLTAQYNNNSTSIEVTVVRLEPGLYLTGHHYGSSATPTDSIEIQQYIQYNWQRVQLQTYLRLTDNTLIPVDDVAYESPADNTGLVTITGNISYPDDYIDVTANYNFSGSNIVGSYRINVSNDILSIINFTASLSDDQNIVLEAIFSDGSTVNNLATIDSTLVDKLFNFNITPSHVANIPGNVLTILNDHYQECTLTVYTNGLSQEVTFAANVPIQAGGIDLGNREGVPQPIVSVDDTFTTDVRIHHDQPLSGMAITLRYNESVINVISVTITHPGFTVQRTRSPEGTIKILSAVIGSLDYDEVKVAEIEWRAVDEGFIYLYADHNLIYDTLSSYSSSSLLPIVVSNDKDTIPPFTPLNYTDHTDDIQSVVYTIKQLTTEIYDAQLNADYDFNTLNNTYDVIYRIRNEAGLVPYLIMKPQVTSVSPDNNCYLTISAMFAHPSGSGVHIYFIVSDDSDNFDDYISVTQPASDEGFVALTGKKYRIFEATQLDDHTYSTSLYTPINYFRQGETGLSVVAITTDEDSQTSTSRFVSFFGPKTSIRSPGIQDVNFTSGDGAVSLKGVDLHLEGQLASFAIFTNNLRSDYCQFNQSELVSPPIPEDEDNGTTFYTISAVGQNFPTDDKLAYEFADGNDDLPFGINATTGGLFVDGELDYDNDLTSYIFDVVATNTDNDIPVGTATIIVNITDVNDNAPTFDQNIYSIKVAEDISVYSTIITVTADDDDSTEANSAIEYQIVPASNDKNTFIIDENSGNITLGSTNLDRETQESYLLTVLAIDSGISPLTGTTLINITVLDINDNSPIFTSPKYTIHISEDAAYANNGSEFISTVISATDSDKGNNGTVYLSIAQDELCISTFGISDNGDITILNMLDRETRDSYECLIEAMDGGDKPRNSTAKLIIIITDVNDNAPMFVNVSQTTFLVENDLVEGSLISAFTATDIDLGENSTIVYSIVEEESSFEIHSNTGELTVKSPLVIDNGLQMAITVVAMDQGPIPLSTTITIYITVIEGQVISFEVGKKGFIIGSHTRDRDIHSTYIQDIGYLFGEEIGQTIEVKGRVGTAISTDQESADISNLGGVASYVNARVLQDRVHHSIRKITVFVQALDGRSSIAKPTLIKIQVNPSPALAALSNTNPIAYCTTSALGYCVAAVQLPDEWFERDEDSTNEYVTVYANIATEETNNSITSLLVEPSPIYASTFLSNFVDMVLPTHTIYTDTVFTVQLYIKAPSAANNFYTQLSFDIMEYDGYDIENYWDCSTANGGIHFDCTVQSSELGNEKSLKVGDFRFIVPSGESDITVAFTDIRVPGITTMIDQQADFSAQEKDIQYIIAASRQPDIVNTAAIDGVDITSDIHYMGLHNSIAVTDFTGLPGTIIAAHPQGCSFNGQTTLTVNDCESVTVSQGSEAGTGTMTFNAINSQTILTPSITYHVWTPQQVAIDVSDDTLAPVDKWRSSCENENLRYQAARITVMCNFSDGAGNSFNADITSLVSGMLTVTSDSVAIDPVHRQVEGKSMGAAVIQLRKPDQSTWPGSVTVSVVNSTSLTDLQFDPIISSLRLSAINTAVSRLTPSSVSLSLLDSLFYLNEDREVTVSVVLSDGRRLLITDPTEIYLHSSNTSVVNVTNKYVRALNEGVAYLNVSWIVCDETILWRVIEVSVAIDRYRPTFTPNTGNVTVPEDSPIGHSITTVQAVDEGAIGTLNDVQYSLQDGFFSEIFAVDQVTGEVTLIAPLDRELEDQYILVIEATDQVQRNALEKCMEEITTETPLVSSGSEDIEPLTGDGRTNISCAIIINTFTLTVIVGDVNDNPPQCPSYLPTIHILNTTTPNTVIGNIQLYDADIGINAKLTYSLEQHEDVFTIDPDSGDISTIIDLSPRESTYDPVVVAVDGGGLVARCDNIILIEVYRFDDTVTVTLEGNIKDFNVELFMSLLSDILGYSVEVAQINPLENGLFEVIVYALDSGNFFVNPDTLAMALRNSSTVTLLNQAGFAFVNAISNKPVIITEEPTLDREIPDWAIAIIIIFNSIVIISILLLIVALLWRRLIRIREEERRQQLNKQRGLRSMESLVGEDEDGEHFEMGGINDPERGALVYERRTQVETVEGGTKQVKRIVQQTSWLKRPDEQTLPVSIRKQIIVSDEDTSDIDEPRPPPPEEKSPLYSIDNLETDFNNPIYSRPHVWGGDHGEDVPLDDMMPLSPDDMTGVNDEVTIAEVDTLF